MMERVGAAVGWTIYRHDDRYYVRLEEVVSMLSGQSAARDILAFMLRNDSVVTPDYEQDE